MSRKVVPLVVGLIVAAAVAYGVYWLLQPRAVDEPVRSADDLERVCFGAGAQRYFPRVNAYTGEGPHPVVMFREGPLGTHRVAVYETDTPQQWSMRELPPEQAQLVLCMGEPADGGLVGQCKFTADTMPLHRGVYDATLYEAQTRREIATGRLEGSAKQDCPRVVSVKGNTDKLFTKPDYAELRKVFGKYVDN